jgi:hypothetical protein
MPGHHTKDKGDLGVAKAFADLVGKGYLVLFPATEHAPFDLVAYLDGRFTTVQVKYRTMKAGKVFVDFRSIWSDRHGAHKKLVDKAAIDVLCVYVPDTDECYYVRPSDFGQSVTLRVTPSRNNQQVGVLPVTGLRDLPVAPRRP